MNNLNIRKINNARKIKEIKKVMNKTSKYRYISELNININEKTLSKIILLIPLLQISELHQ